MHISETAVGDDEWAVSKLTRQNAEGLTSLTLSTSFLFFFCFFFHFLRSGQDKTDQPGLSAGKRLHRGRAGGRIRDRHGDTE